MDEPRHITLTIPNFSGYKTLIVNALMLAIGGLMLAAPGAVLPSPEQLGVAYDTFAAAFAAAVPIVNMLLRLMTSGPVPPAVNLLGVQPRRNGNSTALADYGLGLAHGEQDAIERLRAGEVVRGIRLRKQTAKAVVDRELDAAIAALAAEPQVKSSGPVIPPPVRELQPRPMDLDDLRSQGLDDDDDQRSFFEPFSEAANRVAREARDLLDGTAKATAATAMAFLLALPLPSIAVGSVMLLAGCETVREVNAVAAAETIEQRAFALYSTFTTLEESGARLVADRTVPANLRRAIQQADRVAKPAADGALAALRRLKAVKATTLAGGVSPAALEAATASLEAATAALAPHIARMTAAVTEGTQARKVA